MEEVRTRIRNKKIKNLSLEQIQGMILWIYGALPEEKTRSPSFFSIVNRQCLESTNLVFCVFQKGLEGEDFYGICQRYFSRKCISLKENISLPDTWRLILKKIDRRSIACTNAAITEQSIQPFLIRDLRVIFSIYEQKVPSHLSLCNVNYREFATSSQKSGYFLVSIDCEMVATDAGHEVGRVSIVDQDYNVVYDKYVKPRGKVINFLKEYSGLDEEKLSKGISFEQMKSDLSNIVGRKTVILGHSLESDLVALNFYHERIIDTSHVFLTKDNRRLRLKDLMMQYFNVRTQDHEHCSVEDARNCLKLLRYKLSEFDLLDRSKEKLQVNARINYIDARKNACEPEFLKICTGDLGSFLKDRNLNVVLTDQDGFLSTLSACKNRRQSVSYYFCDKDGKVVFF